MDLTLLYRGPLASCDYDCPYCPFAKRRDSREQLRADRASLERFAAWADTRTEDRLSVLFAPWGEGLVRSWYRRALIDLSHRPHIRRVAIQTNLSCRTDWLADADRDTLALWCTTIPARRRTTGSSASAGSWTGSVSGTASASSGCPSTSTWRGGCAPSCRSGCTCG